MHNVTRLFELVCRYTIRLGEWEDKLATVKKAAEKELVAVKKATKKKAESNAAIMKGLNIGTRRYTGSR